MHQRKVADASTLLSGAQLISGVTQWINVIINGAERVIKARREISALLLDQHSLRIDNMHLTANDFKHANVRTASPIDFLGHNVSLAIACALRSDRRVDLSRTSLIQKRSLQQLHLLKRATILSQL